MTIVCACLFGSKPVFMRLIPDKVISRLKSQSRSSSRYLPGKLMARMRTIGSKKSKAKSSHHEVGSSFAPRNLPNQATRYTLEKYDTQAESELPPGCQRISESSLQVFNDSNSV